MVALSRRFQYLAWAAEPQRNTQSSHAHARAHTHTRTHPHSYTGEADYSQLEAQAGIVNIYEAVGATSKVVNSSAIPWILIFFNWAKPSTIKFENTLCTEGNPLTGGDCGLKYNCTVQTNMDDGFLFIPQPDFYRCLELWINIDRTSELLSPGLLLVDPDAPIGSKELVYVDEAKTKLPISSGGLFASGLATNDDFVTLITEVRAVTGNDTVPPSFAGGIPFDFWAQYLGECALSLLLANGRGPGRSALTTTSPPTTNDTDLREVISTAIGYASGVAFGACALLIMLMAERSPTVGSCKVVVVAVWGAALIVVTIVLSVYSIYGFCGFGRFGSSCVSVCASGLACVVPSFFPALADQCRSTTNDRNSWHQDFGHPGSQHHYGSGRGRRVHGAHLPWVYQ